MALESLRRLVQNLRSGGSGSRAPWRPPLVLDRGDLGSACLALDDHGRGAAVWDSGGHLWTLPVGPQAEPALMRLPLGEGRDPGLVLNPEGRGFIVWQARQGEEREILAKAFGRETGGQVLFRTGGRIRHLQSAVDRRGNALVVWLHEIDGRAEVQAQSFDLRESAWAEAPVVLGLGTGSATEPRLAANFREHAMVLWEAVLEVPEGQAEGLVASHHWPADRIWSDRPVPVVGHPTHHHQVALDDLGNALVLWLQTPYGQRCTLQASYYDGQRSEWRPPETLSHAHTFSPPKLVLSADGMALAAWCQAEAHGASRLIVREFSRGTWQEGAECLETGQEPVQDFAVDLASDGRAALVAVHRGPEGEWVSARLRDRGWGEAFPLVHASPASCSAPQVRITPMGASALWIQGAGRERALFLAETR